MRLQPIVRGLTRLLLGRRLPTTSGEIVLEGIHDSIVIGRDRWGIPHIRADRDDDTWFGLGFCQGQDRAFQIEMLARVVRGTLAEIAGQEALPVDRLSRRIGFRATAERQLALLSPEAREAGQAFARGVTCGASKGLRKRPHEFVLLRCSPSEYTAADIVALAALQSFLLPSNWDSELARLKILSEDGPEALVALDPSYPEWHATTMSPHEPAGPEVDRLLADLTIVQERLGLGGGSNSWALAGQRTASGRPLLANDPHLAPMLPPHWYLAHLETADWAIAGACLAGTPVFAAGHNGFAAWGITAAVSDNTDLFVEHMGADGRSVRGPDGPAACDERTERIAVKGQGVLEEKVLVTPRGPIIGPALEGESRAISIRATWLLERPIRGLFEAHKFRSVEGFREAMSSWPGPCLNVTYADASGTIAWQLAGDLPRRRRGFGTLPLPTDDGEAGWKDEPVPFDCLPHAINPERGFIATANNRPTGSDDGPFLGCDWFDGYRFQRIVNELSRCEDWDVRGVATLQLDKVSLPWLEVREQVIRAARRRVELARIASLLDKWDGTIAADSEAAAVFELWLAEMSRRIALAKASRSAAWALGKGFTPVMPLQGFALRRTGHLVRLLREQPQGWFARSWADEIANALVAASRELDSISRRHRARRRRAPVAAGAGDRAWGAIRPLTLQHPLGARKPLDRVFNLGPFPWGGDANTVGQAGGDPANPAGNPIFVASMRIVIDVGNWDGCTFVLLGGQSGNPLSRHYDDMLPLWRRGEGVPIPFSRERVDESVTQVLRLRPARSHERSTGNE